MPSLKSRAVGTLFVLCLVGALGVWGCDQGGSPAPTPTGPSVGTVAASGASIAAKPTPAPSPSPNTPPADQDLIDALTEAIQDEYHAVWAYQYVLGLLGNVKPFANIENAEKQHVDAIAKLFGKRALDVPDSEWGDDDLPELAAITSLKEACQAGVEAENENIAMYRRLLEGSLPDDVAKVFAKLMSASLENHLPAFQNCVDKAK